MSFWKNTICYPRLIKYPLRLPLKYPLRFPLNYPLRSIRYEDYKWKVPSAQIIPGPTCQGNAAFTSLTEAEFVRCGLMMVDVGCGLEMGQVRKSPDDTRWKVDSCLDPPDTPKEMGKVQKVWGKTPCLWYMEGLGTGTPVNGGKKI